MSKFGGIPINQPQPAGQGSGSRFGGIPAQAPQATHGAVNDGKTLHNAPLPVQALGGFTEGLAGLPGMPLDMMIGGANFIRRQFDAPEFVPNETVRNFTSEGVSGAVMGAAGMPKVAAPTNNLERVVQKGSKFLGGGVPFGPAGLVPTATAFAGSEAGRVADQVAPEYTKGYAEFGGGVAGGIAGAYRPQPIRTPAPTTAELKAQASAAYDAAERAGVVYTPHGVARIGGDIVADLANDGYHPQMQPKIAPILSHLEELAQGNVTLKGVDTLRKMAGNAAKSLDPTERMMASKIIERLDDFVESPMQGEVLTGNAQAGAAALKDARALYHRMSKADRIETALENAKLQAESTYSGGNIDNATRQKLRPMLVKGNKAARGWTADEKAMLRRVVKGGGVVHKLARQVGKLSPEGNGLMAQLGLMTGGAGAVSGFGPLGLLPSAAGFLAKRASNAMTNSNVQQLLDAVRRGKAYQPRTPGRMLTRAAAAVPGIASQDRDR